jgi:hypothetical protein
MPNVISVALRHPAQMMKRGAGPTTDAKDQFVAIGFARRHQNNDRQK